MTWTPHYGRHISQIHPQTGSGADDCGPASVTRYLFEAGKLPIALDPFVALAQVAAIVRGVPDSPIDNAVTSGNDLIDGLTHYGITATWTDSYQSCLAAAWSIVLVRGPDLQPAPCPLSWWGNPPSGSGDHWMLWLPAWKGAASWFNNPLQYTPGQVDAPYDLGALRGAFYGGILLPTTNNGETPLQHWTAKRKFALKITTNDTCAGLAHVPAGGTGLVEPGEFTDAVGLIWQRMQFRDQHGWAPADYITTN